MLLPELFNSLERVESLNPEGMAPRALRTSAKLVTVTLALRRAQRSRPFRGEAEELTPKVFLIKAMHSNKDVLRLTSS